MSSYSVAHQMKLYVLVALTGMLFGAELVASQVSKSFVLLAEAYHTLYNLMSLLLLVIGYRTSKVRTLKNTFGWARLEVLGILFNVLVLCSLYLSLTLATLLHLFHAGHDPIRPLYPLLVLALGLCGLLANFICLILIGGYTHHQDCYLSIEGSEVHLGYVVGEQTERQSFCDANSTVNRNESECQGSQQTEQSGKVPRKQQYNRFLLCLLRDASSCLLVIASSCVVHFLKEPLGGALADYADSVATLLGVILQIATTYPFLKETGMILLQTVPNNIDIEQLKKRIKKEFPDIQNVHELHVWKQSKSHVIATVHIIVSSHSVYASLSARLQTFFQQQGIASATVQPEFHNGTEHTMPDLLNGCILPCTANCLEPTCCRPSHGENGVRERHGHSHGTSGHHHHHHYHHHHSHSYHNLDQTEQDLTEEKESTNTKEENVELHAQHYDYSKLKDSMETVL